MRIVYSYSRLPLTAIQLPFPTTKYGVIFKKILKKNNPGVIYSVIYSVIFSSLYECGKPLFGNNTFRRSGATDSVVPESHFPSFPNATKQLCRQLISG